MTEVERVDSAERFPPEFFDEDIGGNEYERLLDELEVDVELCIRDWGVCRVFWACVDDKRDP